jgi:hypothetical protein
MSIPPLDQLAAETRRAKRERVLGDDAACVLCGLGTLASLVLVNRNVLEAHHIVGRANDGALTAPLCRNCHAEITEGYRDSGVSLNRPPTLLHKLVAVLRAVGAMLIALGQKCAEWAEALFRLVQRLDTELPDWRALDEASA